MRRPHYLAGNAAREMPSKIVCVDVETDSRPINDRQVEAVLRFGFACFTSRQADHWSSPEWKKFADAGDFWDWLVSKTAKKHKLYVYAHNVSFDLVVLQQARHLTARGWQLVRCILDEPPTVFTWRLGETAEEQKRENRTITVIDTLNYWRSSLKELGRQLGCSKLEMPAQDASQELWDDYCKQDANVVREAVLSLFGFVQDNDLGNYQLTAASQAFSAFRHRFMPVAPFCDDHTVALDIARRSYNGGRTEAFRIGTFSGDFYCLDVNSEYPFIMSQAELPVQLVSVWKNPTAAEMEKLLAKYFCVADLVVRTKQPVYPSRIGEWLCWPVGRFPVTLADPELRYAWAHGDVVRVKAVAFYTKAVLFGDYVREIYAMRKRFEAAGNKPYAALSKLMLNSLYGKFGQTGRALEWAGECDPAVISAETVIDAQTGTKKRRLMYAGVVQEWADGGESTNSSPAVASGVTSGGRMLLWQFMTAAGLENLFYCDTDSLFVNRQGYENLLPWVDDRELGRLKLEMRGDRLEIRGLKDYDFGTKHKIKGVRGNARQIDANTYEQDTFRGIKGMLDDHDTERVLISKTVKHLTRKYTKGVVENDRIIPFEL